MMRVESKMRVANLGIIRRRYVPYSSATEDDICSIATKRDRTGAGRTISAACSIYAVERSAFSLGLR